MDIAFKMKQEKCTQQFQSTSFVGLEEMNTDLSFNLLLCDQDIVENLSQTDYQRKALRYATTSTS